MGDENSLHTYIREHEDSLRAELATLRERAKFDLVASAALPVSEEDWLLHLDAYNEEFSRLLRDVVSQRRSISQKVIASDCFVGERRVYAEPCREHGHCPRYSYLGAGLFAFKFDEAMTAVVYVASIGHVVFGVTLSSAARKREYDLVLAPLFHTRFKPLPLVFEEFGVDDSMDLSVFSLVWKVSDVAHDRVSVVIVGAEEAVRPIREASAGSSGDLPVAVASDELDSIDELVAMDEDVCSVCPSDDSDEDSVSDELSEEVASSDSECGPRKPAGAHVYYSNGYFTFTDNVSYPDIKCHVVSKWCTRSYMGVHNKSKTLVPSHFGDSRGSPIRAKLVLRAWMLQKFTTNDFASGRAARRKLFNAEVASLRGDIIDMSSEANMTTGNKRADELIFAWAPMVMATS